MTDERSPVYASLAGKRAASGLFVDRGSLPAPLDLDPLEEPARD